jgi:acetate kinase
MIVLAINCGSSSITWAAFVIPTDEELYIARDTVQALGAPTRVTGQE